MSILIDIYIFCRAAPRHPIQATKKLFQSQWARFTLMGFFATLVYYLLGLFFVSLLKLPLLVGNTLAFILSFAVSFLGQARWTFKSNRSIPDTLPKFALAQVFALFLNSFIIDTLCRRLTVPYPLAMIAAIIIVPVITYLICKFWIFRKKPT